jgi:hypothetical protein
VQFIVVEQMRRSSSPVGGRSGTMDGMGEIGVEQSPQRQRSSPGRRALDAIAGLLMVLVGGGFTVQAIWFCVSRVGGASPARAALLVMLALACVAIVAWSWRYSSQRYSSVRRVVEETCWRSGALCLGVGLVAILVADVGR